MANLKSAAIAKINVFGGKPASGIIVPEIAMNARNNCQSGKWFIGDKEYGSKAEFTILKFSRFMGSLGQTQNALWGQIWLIAESGELPKDVVMVTYIKGRSLSSFNSLIAEVQSRGVEPAEGIFVPEFVKHSGNKPDENGIPRPINYYSLQWHWRERKTDAEFATLDKAALCLEDPSNLSRMVDFEGTQEMILLDNLPPHEIANVISATQMRSQDSTNPPLLPAA